MEFILEAKEHPDWPKATLIILKKMFLYRSAALRKFSGVLVLAPLWLKWMNGESTVFVLMFDV